MLNRVTFILAAVCTLTLSTLAGCVKTYDSAPEQDNPIQFQAGAGSLLLNDDYASKADNDYYDNTSFGVFAFKQIGGTWEQLATKNWKPDYMFNQKVVHSLGSAYTYSPTRYWPDPSESSLSFWAYSPYDENAGLLVSGSTSTTYTSTSVGLPDMRFTADGHTDLLYSNVVADQTFASNSGVVDLAFNHALSLVDVKAEKLDEGGLYTVTLEEVGFRGIFATAILGSSDWTWGNYGGSRQDLPVWDGNTVLAHGTATPLAGVMPIPQDLSNDACRLHVAFRVSYYEDPLDESTLVEYSTTRDVYLRDVFNWVGSVWERNKHYTVTIRISPDRPILFTVSWSEWGAEHNYQLSS